MTDVFPSPRVGHSPSPAAGADSLLDLPEPPAQLLEKASLFLDFDGTLVELADRPDGVHVSPDLRALLAGLVARFDGRLAIVSGRGADDVAGLLGHPPCLVVGSHGAEFRDQSGRITAAPRSPALEEATLAFHAFAEGREGLLVEDKPQGVALHYRRVPALEEACRSFAAGLAGKLGLHLQTGKMMIELRIGGADKGSAIHQLMDLPRMAGTAPVFLGDDDTDEPAFEAALALGGAGILVGPARPSAALWRLEDVAAVHRWLEGEAA